MNINVAISVENCIIREGLSKIISDGFLTSRIFFIDKKNVEQITNLQQFHIVILDDNDMSKYLKFIIKMSKNQSYIKFFFLTNKKLSINRINVFRKNSILIINYCNSAVEILSMIQDSILSIGKIKTSVKNKTKTKVEETNPFKLLSSRELQIALLLVKGLSTTEISREEKISMTTVSTYKSRIFQKTKTKNLMQVSSLFRT